MTRTISYAFGVLLAVLGIWGFVQNPVFGIFEGGKLQSLLYLASGAVLVGSAAWSKNAGFSVKLFGVLYALVAIFGFVMDGSMLFGFINSSVANNILHTILAVIFLWAGFMTAEEDVAAPAPLEPQL